MASNWQQNDGQGSTTCLYAWIATDAGGQEGIIVAPIPPLGVVPLVMTDQARAFRLEPAALLAAIERKATARLVKFHRGEVLKIVEP